MVVDTIIYALYYLFIFYCFQKVDSTQGLITTIAYKIGKSPPIYALEGSVAVAGAALAWLKDNLELFSNLAQSQDMAESVRCSGDVYFVPAFSGLYAPYWQQDARGYIFCKSN